MTHQSIPECFENKIKIDQEVVEYLSQPVVEISEARRLFRAQTHASFLCMKHIERARTNPGGATTA